MARKTGAQKLVDGRKPEVVVLPKRTGREGTARANEELAHPALPERIRCA